MSRLTFITLLSIIILAVAVIAHWRGGQVNDVNKQQSQISEEADFFMLNVDITQFNDQGKIDHRLNSDKIKHFPIGDFTTASNPDVTFFDANGTPWDVNAKHGRMSKNNDIIDLWGDVELNRNTPANPLNLKTTEMTLVTSKKLAHTDKDVVIIDNSSHITATGMQAYLKKSIINLLSNVRVTHDPAKIN